MTKCKLKLNSSESAVLEFVLNEWLDDTLNAKIRSFDEADIRKFNADIILSILDKIGNSYKDKKSAKFTHDMWAKDIARWERKNSQWFEV